MYNTCSKLSSICLKSSQYKLIHRYSSMVSGRTRTPLFFSPMHIPNLYSNCLPHTCPIVNVHLCSSDFSQESIHFGDKNNQNVPGTEQKLDLCDDIENTLIQEKSLQKEEESDLFDCIDYDEITGGDIESLNRFKLLLLEVEVLRQEGLRVPKKMSTDNWKELFSLETRSQRMRCLNYLWTTEIRKLGDKRKKERKKIAHQEKLEELEKENKNNNHIKYGFQGSTIFIRIYDSTINHYDNCRLIQAMMFGINVVIDCGYDHHMSTMENKLCAKQLMYVFADNRLDRDPFNLHFCNFNKNSILYKQFLKHIETIEDPLFPINIYEEHYLNLFPKEKLVYLTPHCRTELKEFNPEDIYIVGAMVDKHKNEPLSMAKAKSEGIRMAHLPLDRYLQWGYGTKSLTINQVNKILLDARTTGDWNIAFKNVPQRKVRKPGEPIRERKRPLRGTAFQPPPLYRTGRVY